MRSFFTNKNSIIFSVSVILGYNSIHVINYNELGIIENYNPFYFNRTYKLLIPSKNFKIFIEQPFAKVIKIPRNSLTLEMIYTLNDGKKLYVNIKSDYNISLKCNLKFIFKRSIINYSKKDNEFLKQYIDSIIEDDFLIYDRCNTEEEKRKFVYNFWNSQMLKVRLAHEGLNVKDISVTVI